MKAISLHQPWASAIALGAKTIETRGWATAYRGPIAIHAAKRCVRRELAAIEAEPEWIGALWPLRPLQPTRPLAEVLPFGAIVAVAELVDCRPTERFRPEWLHQRRMRRETGEYYDWTEADMGNFAPGRFGWALSDIRALARPVLLRGRQGLFEVDDTLIDAAEVA